MPKEPPPKLTRAEMQRRVRRVGELLKPHGVSRNTVEYLVRNKKLTPERIEERLNRIKRTKMPTKRVVGFLKKSNSFFDYLEWRSCVKHGLPYKKPGPEVRKLDKRVRAVHKQLRSHKVSREQAEALVLENHVTPERIKGRLDAMEQAGALTNVRRMMEITPAKFDTIIGSILETGLTPGQMDVFSYLQSIGVSEGIAKEISEKSSRPHLTLDRLKKKRKHLEGIKLDKERYGVERIPVEYYQAVLGLDFYKIKERLNSRVLDPLEDAHSATLLHEEWPGWDELTTVTELNPTTILHKVRALRERGIEPTSKLVRCTLKDIKAGKVVDPKREDKRAARELDRLWPKWRDYSLIKKYRPPTILRKVRAAGAVGLKPTARLIKNFTLERIASREPHVLNRFAILSDSLPSRQDRLKVLRVAVIAKPGRDYPSLGENLELTLTEGLGGMVHVILKSDAGVRKERHETSKLRTDGKGIAIPGLPVFEAVKVHEMRPWERPMKPRVAIGARV